MKREPDLEGALSAVAPSPHTEAWLLGQPPLRKYLDFVEDTELARAGTRRVDLVREWSAAALYYEELERSEENVADHPVAPPLDPALAPLVDEVMASPRFTRTFDKLPCGIEMGDLANIVVFQNHVTHTFVEQLQERLRPAPDPASLFRFCLPMSEAPAPFRIREAGSKRYVFRSESTDLRFHEAVMLKSEQLGGHDAFGAVAGALALVVGFSSNFLNAVRDDDRGRLLLHNGYHRACALLSMGIRYAPCVVQTVASRDELDIVAKALVASDPGYFFNGPRPPLLKDFLDPHIRKLIPIKKMEHVIEISYEIRDYFAEE
jgi:hypothetical protein